MASSTPRGCPPGPETAPCGTRATDSRHCLRWGLRCRINAGLFVTTGDAIVLNEARSGWVWTVSDGSGTLVPSSQDWELDNKPDPATAPSDEEVPVVIEPKPPVAVADAFGVRAGALVALPVLLNDHDPNEDVLSIDPSSVAGLDPAFGTVTMTDDQQRLAVRVAPDAKGTGTFTYAVTDGTTEGGLLSRARRGHAHRDRALAELRCGVVWRARLSAGLAHPSDRTQRNDHRSRACGLGRPRGGPPSPPLCRDPVRCRHRGFDSRG